MSGLIEALQSYMEDGKKVVLLTVYDRTGSAPRGAGAHMVVGEEGRIYGTIGGGAVEYEAEQRALQVLKERCSCRAHYYLKQNEVQDLGMVCGGEVDVAFSYLNPEETLTRESIRFCQDLKVREETAWLVLNITEECGGGFAFYGRKSGTAGMHVPENVLDNMVSAFGVREETAWLVLNITEECGGGFAFYGRKSGTAGMHVPENVLDNMVSAFGFVEENGRRYYYERLTQPGRVYIFGGGHVAQALVPALSAIDFTCVILEDREEFCKPELFPKAERVLKINMQKIAESVTITEEDYVCVMTRGHKDDTIVQEQILRTPAKAERVLKINMQKIAESVTITEEDYVCVMTRGHKDDTIVQEQILRTPAKYIGVIGSRKKKAAVFRALKQSGLTEKDLERITTPIGLEIQAETPAEIAVSIAAQLIQVRAGRGSV